jgi:electron transport complex protein RnfB
MRPNRADARQAELPGGSDPAADIDRLLPQTQCRRCGYAGCRPYADAIAAAGAPINRCPPGGAATVDALSRLLGTPVIALDPDCGPVPRRSVAFIDNSRCIGCTKCILACPVDAIAGAPRHQHHVLADRCTGCELCLAPCPVDCIVMKPLAQAWSDVDAENGRRHHQARLERLARLEQSRPRAPVQAGQAGQSPGSQAQDPQADRDPLVALGSSAERARRLAQILARVRAAEGAP